MVEDFKADLTKIDKDEPNAEQKEDIKEKIKELKMQKSHFSNLLKIKEYFNYSKAFDELNKIFNNNEQAKNEQKSKKYQELYDDFNKSFINSLQIFLNASSDQDMTNRIKTIVGIIEKITDRNKIIETQKYLDLLYKDLNDSVKLSIKQFQNLKELVGKLSKEGKGLETFTNLIKEFELIEFFIKKDKKLRIPLFGGYSTGKSSLLNCIIGKKILPEGNKVTTRKIVVIRNNDENKFTISKTNFVKTNGEYYCFEDGDIIENIDTPEKIYEFLKKENEDKTNENMFFLVSAPILLFKKMKLSKEILNKIEFIDFPGIDATELEIIKIFNNLASFSDTFIFVNECNLIKNKDNITIMQSIVNRIENRRFNFDYNSCLFVLNKVDEEKNVEKNKKKKEIEDIFFGEKIMDSTFDFFKKKENPDISITFFSCYYYLQYLKFYDEFKVFERFIDSNIEDEDDNDLIEQLQENIQNKLEIDFVKIEDKRELMNDAYFSRFKSCLMKKGISEEYITNNTKKLENIVNNYIIMENNLEKNQYYIESKVSSLIEELEKKFIIAKNMTEKQFGEKIKKFINTLQNIFRLLQQKSLNKTVCDISKAREVYEKNSKEINSIYNEYSKSLQHEIDTTIDDLKNQVDNLINLGKQGNIKYSELKNQVELFKNDYKNKVKTLDDFIKDKLVTFHLKVNKTINTELINFGIINTNEEQSYMEEGLQYVWKSFVVVSSAVVYLVSGVIMFLVGGIGKLVNLMRGKSAIIKELEGLSKEIEMQFESTSFKCHEILTKSFTRVSENLKMIYETQISQINEKKSTRVI